MRKIIIRLFGIHYLICWLAITAIGQDFPDVDSLSIFKGEMESTPRGLSLCELQMKIASLHYEGFELDSAEKYFQLSRSCAEEQENVLIKSRALYQLGIIYYDRGLRSTAVDLHHQALSGFKVVEDSFWIAKTFNVIGNTYNYIGEHERAREYYGEALAIFAKLEDFKHLAFVTGNLAIMHGEEGDGDRAIELHLKEEEALKRLDNDRHLGTTYYNLAIQYKDLGSYDKSIDYYDQALSISVKHDNHVLTGLIYQGIGATRVKQRRYDEALMFLEKALEIGKQTENEQVKANAIQNLVLCYEGMGDFKKALEYARIEQEMDSLLYNTQNATILNEIETRYKVAQKEKENEILKQRDDINKAEIEKQRLINWIALTGSVLLVAFALVLYSGRNKLKKHRDEIAHQASKLKQLDEFKSRFFANVSHDIRTPLTLIAGYAYQIKTDQQNYLSQKSESNLVKLQENGAKLTRMADEIRDLILLEEGKLVLSYSGVKVSPYLSKLVRMFGSAAELKGIRLTFQSKVKEQYLVHIDQGKFEQIIYNLMSNALRYTEESGAIAVKLETVGEKGFGIAIEDTGKGIDEDYLPFIFDRYYQTPNNPYQEKEGLGIGLALVRELTQLHGGSIEVESKKSEGTTFRLYFPHNRDKEILMAGDELVRAEVDPLPYEAKETEIRNQHVAVGPESQSVVLIVDDHPEVREYVKDLIRDSYQVMEAKNGQDALKVLARHKVDLIITDLMMPWLDGFGLIEKLKSESSYKNIPVLVVSARTTEEDKMKVLDQGVNDFISKPFDPVELLKRIENRIHVNGEGVGNPWMDLMADNERTNQVEQNIMRKINHLVMQRISDSSLGVKDIAYEICASERKTYRLIKDLTDHTPLDYIKLIRFDYAKELIQNNKVKSASEAAKAIGMSNVTQFNKQYQKHFGSYPSGLV